MDVAILEDNSAITDVLTNGLQMAGHKATAYTNGSHLLQALLQSDKDVPPYDVLLVNYMLPGGMTGKDVIVLVREVFSAKQLPIIIISGVGPERLAPVQQEFPDVVILHKPFRIAQLLQLIEKSHLSRK